MATKKIYLAGKVSGLSRQEAFDKFEKTEKRLIDSGYKVVNPMRITSSDDTWEAAMKTCIKALVDCEEIHLLPCWKESRGATIERALAISLQIPIVLQ